MPDVPPDLTYRFEALDRHLADLRESIRMLAPLVVQTTVLETKMEDVEQHIAAMKAEVLKVADSTTQIIRSNRADTIKLALALVGPATVAALGLIAALLTGEIG